MEVEHELPTSSVNSDVNQMKEGGDNDRQRLMNHPRTVSLVTIDQFGHDFFGV